MTFELTDEERQELADLATLSPVEYDRCRKEAAKRFCCRVGMLDQEVQALRNGRPGEKETTEQGTALTIADPEPWPVPVDGSDLLDELAAAFRLFLALAEHADVALALWTVHAHAHDTAEVSPILGITSPDKRCGKTTLLFLLGALVPRSLPAANVTPAAMFRTVEKYRPTLLVDEGDTFLKSNDELRGILNSGHSKGAAIVVRTVGEDHEPRTFSTWGPKAIALIGKLPGTLADRAIEVPMQRKTGAERVEKLRLDRLGGLEPLRQQAWRWTRDELEDLQTADPVVPEALHDRAADNWRPLLAIADQAGGEWPARARRAALALSGLAADEEESAGVLALHDVAALFEELEQEQLSSEAIVNRLVEMDERPWPEWYGKPLSKGALARLLRPFDVRPRQLWIAGQKARGYRREDFEEPLSRYVTPSESVGLVEWLNHAGSGLIPETVGRPSPTVSEIAVSRCETTGLPDPPDQPGGPAHRDTFDSSEWEGDLDDDLPF